MTTSFTPLPSSRSMTASRRATLPIALTLVVIGSAALLAALPGLTAHAGGDDEIFTASDPLWKEECGSCHVPYPPALLPAESWRALMAGLDDHFGTDASLDAAAAAWISAFLERSAGRGADGRPGAGGTPPLRITQTRWFLHEHDDISPRIWNSPEVVRGVNCEACHRQAASGDFSERYRELPR